MQHVLAWRLHAIADVVHALAIPVQNFSQMIQGQIIELDKMHSTEITMMLMLYIGEVNHC